MSHTSLFTSHIFHKFKSKVSFILSQHNKHLISLVEIHYGRACNTCPHGIFQKWCTMYGFNSRGKGKLACMLQHQMIMFDLSNNQHCIFILSKVVAQVKGLIRASCFCV
jgi:hypothetical protein